MRGSMETNLLGLARLKPSTDSWDPGRRGSSAALGESIEQLGGSHDGQRGIGLEQITVDGHEEVGDGELREGDQVVVLRVAGDGRRVRSVDVELGHPEQRCDEPRRAAVAGLARELRTRQDVVELVEESQ